VLPVAKGGVPGGTPMAGQKLMSPPAAAPLPDLKTATSWVVLEVLESCATPGKAEKKRLVAPVWKNWPAGTVILRPDVVTVPKFEGPLPTFSGPPEVV